MSGRRTDAAMLGLCALAPACLAALHAGGVPDAAHDAAVARALGLDPQPWRALDVAASTLLAAAPVGTRALRAALGSALVTAAAGAALYVVIRRLLGACAATRRLGPLAAAVAALIPLASAPWQIEASAVGGSVTGALLVLLPLALLSGAAPPAPGRVPPDAAAAFAVGLAIGYEPLVGACAAAGCAALVAAGGAPGGAGSLRGALRSRARVLGPAFALGLAPFAIAIGRARGSGAPLAAALVRAWSGERGAPPWTPPGAFVGSEIGPALALLAAAGLALAVLVARARPIALALLAVAAAGLGAAWLGAPAGPARFGGPVLAGFAATAGLAAVALQAIVRAVARARVPLARTSASMVLLLEAVMPVDRADDALVRAQARASGAASAWSDAAWGDLPPRSIVLLTDPRLYERALADRARGAVRGDLAIVPAFAAAWRPLEGDAALVPLRRDLELSGAPSEESLSSLAAARPLAVAFDPRWGKALARHLVPLVLLDRFEPEPRGASDRRRALDDTAAERARLARAVAGDADLAGAAASLLRARASGLDLDGERDLAARARADARPFEP